MNRRQADIVAGGFVVTVVLVGLALFWQEFQQQQRTDGMMQHMGQNTTDPIWILAGTALIAVVVGGAYLFVRDEFPVEGTESAAAGTVDQPAPVNEPTDGTAQEETATPAEPQHSPSPDDDSPTDQSAADGEKATNSEDPSQRPLLDMLPEDERKVLQPVIDSPGITQVALRDRASFSKSKVSQTVSDLEKRGLLYREKQGRTYRVFPTEDVQSSGSE